jgi:hypothetical protein
MSTLFGKIGERMQISVTSFHVIALLFLFFFFLFLSCYLGGEGLHDIVWVHLGQSIGICRLRECCLQWPAS